MKYYQRRKKKKRSVFYESAPSARVIRWFVTNQALLARSHVMRSWVVPVSQFFQCATFLQSVSFLRLLTLSYFSTIPGQGKVRGLMFNSFDAILNLMLIICLKRFHLSVKRSEVEHLWRGTRWTNIVTRSKVLCSYKFSLWSHPPPKKERKKEREDKPTN